MSWETIASKVTGIRTQYLLSVIRITFDAVIPCHQPLWKHTINPENDTLKFKIYFFVDYFNSRNLVTTFFVSRIPRCMDQCFGGSFLHTGTLVHVSTRACTHYI